MTGEHVAPSAHVEFTELSEGIVKLRIVRKPLRLSPKGVAALLGGVTASGIVWALSLVGVQLDPALAGLAVSIIGVVALYLKGETAKVPKRSVGLDRAQ